MGAIHGFFTAIGAPHILFDQGPKIISLGGRVYSTEYNHNTYTQLKAIFITMQGEFFKLNKNNRCDKIFGPTIVTCTEE